MASGPDRIESLRPNFLALSAAERHVLVRTVREDRLNKKVLPRAVKTAKRQHEAKLEKLAAAMKTMRAEWLPLLLGESDVSS